MPQIFGANTNRKDANGKSIYEYDRVSFQSGVCTRTGTVINVIDPWYPEFKILVDQFYWRDENKPEYVDLTEDVKILTKNDKGYRVVKTLQEFMKYCAKYDYHKHAAV